MKKCTPLLSGIGQGAPIKLSSIFMTPQGYTHHGEQDVAASPGQGDKRLVVSFSLAHFGEHKKVWGSRNLCCHR